MSTSSAFFSVNSAIHCLKRRGADASHARVTEVCLQSADLDIKLSDWRRIAVPANFRCGLFLLTEGIRNNDDLDRIFDSVAFVNFNYDRCLEQFLWMALQQFYLITEDKAGREPDLVVAISSPLFGRYQKKNPRADIAFL
jgi:hypothetical protein